VADDRTFESNYTRLLGPPKYESDKLLYYCPFPECAGRREQTLYVNPQLGGWICHHCCQAVEGKDYSRNRVNHGGGWREFIALVGDEANYHLWPKGKVDWGRPQAPILTWKERRRLWGALFALGSLSAKDHAAIAGRGIDPLRLGAVSCTTALWERTVELFGEEFCVRGGLAYEDAVGELQPTRCVVPGRILIPYWDGEEVRYFVGYAPGRAQKPTEANAVYESVLARHVKYAGPTHYDTQIFGRVPYGAAYLIITEGQLKAEAARQRGYPCVGLQGMGSKHITVAEECTMKGVERVFIIFDTQQRHQALVDHEAACLARELLRVEIPVYRVSLPLEDGERKADLDSYLLHHSTDEFDRLLVASTQFPYRLESATVSEKPCLTSRPKFTSARSTSSSAPTTCSASP
jgi:hypothetical protein